MSLFISSSDYHIIPTFILSSFILNPIFISLIPPFMYALKDRHSFYTTINSKNKITLTPFCSYRSLIINIYILLMSFNSLPSKSHTRSTCHSEALLTLSYAINSTYALLLLSSFFSHLFQGGDLVPTSLPDLKLLPCLSSLNQVLCEFCKLVSLHRFFQPLLAN